MNPLPMRPQKKQNGQRYIISETTNFLNFKKMSLEKVSFHIVFISKYKFSVTNTGNLLGTPNPGRYEYPYRFVLPRNLPGTYSSPNNGYIRYSVKATVDIPMAFDYEDEKVFVVQSFLDLNENPRLQLVSFSTA